jgi:hypothetical protein
LPGLAELEQWRRGRRSRTNRNEQRKEEPLRIAVVHDWLYTIGGAERVLGEILRCYPQADVYALFDVLSPLDRTRLGFEKTHTSFLQNMPFIRSRHRLYLPLMPIAIEQFDLSDYDLVISSSYAVAKGVLTTPDQVHVSYIHSPIRYAWDMQHNYLRQSGYSRGLKSVLARVILHYHPHVGHAHSQRTRRAHRQLGVHPAPYPQDLWALRPRDLSAGYRLCL